jgi:hypothetical protein
MSTNEPASSEPGEATELAADHPAPPDKVEDSEGSNSPTGEEEDMGTELVEIDLSPDERNRVIQELLSGQSRTSDPLDDV